VATEHDAQVREEIAAASAELAAGEASPSNAGSA
jgi:hypothetical protein